MKMEAGIFEKDTSTFVLANCSALGQRAVVF